MGQFRGGIRWRENLKWHPASPVGITQENGIEYKNFDEQNCHELVGIKA